MLPAYFSHATAHPFPACRFIKTSCVCFINAASCFVAILFLFFFYIMSTFFLHYFYIMSTLCLHYVYIMSTVCLHYVYIMSTLCLYLRRALDYMRTGGSLFVCFCVDTKQTGATVCFPSIADVHIANCYKTPLPVARQWEELEKKYEYRIPDANTSNRTMILILFNRVQNANQSTKSADAYGRECYY
jgi:hypothetical protein